ncbi:MAG: T9SS type A sorting domain-containing protein [Bacteroidales bacterium]|nr:T9SS type A sorting domain-containing protein [Bacteroidales bacterium]
MRKELLAAALSILMASLVPSALAQQQADSVDVLDCDLAVDLSAGKNFPGDATLTVRLASECSSLKLGLFGKVDSVWVDGRHEPDATIDSIPTAGHTAGDTLKVRVKYHGSGYVESYGWGGFHFDKNMSYNLGVGFGTNPHNMGRALMPCRDNFHDKATYTLRVTTLQDWTAECGGTLLQRDTLEDGREHSVWRIDQPVSTYLVSVSQAHFRRISRMVAGEDGDYPLTLGYTTQDSSRVRRAFDCLDSVVPMFERCLGPYRWGRIGYIATEQGSMEHVNNIALDRSFIASTSERGQMTIAHELGHAWFGNLITCATEADMWINEGGASFCSELAMEATKGTDAARRYYQTNLESVLRTTHRTDGGYRALSPMPHQYTYGSTTYDKGALVWHSLRGLMGDSLFYASMRRLMDDLSFSTATAAEVRDSLESYTGLNLGAFFDFHVFNPGFVDYHVELSGDMREVRLQAQGVGTDVVPAYSTVPVTFFAHDGTATTRWLGMEGTETTHQIEGLGDVAYCVLDYNTALSDAATVERLPLDGTGQRTSKVAHMRVQLDGNGKPGSHIVVEHHWGRPYDTDTLAGIVRTANRYWIVRGEQGQCFGTQGQFYYIREGNGQGAYPNLDPGLYSHEASHDSLLLLYRSSSDEPWQAVSHSFIGDRSEGYMLTDNLRIGEYTLAIADLSQLGLARPQSRTVNLFPNPVRSGGTVRIDLPEGGPCSVSVTDCTGRTLWSHGNCTGWLTVALPLPAGTYLVRIENNIVSLQSKLTVL